MNGFRGGRYHFDDRARKAIPRVAVVVLGGIELVNPLLGILAFVLMENLGIRKALTFDENFRQAGFAAFP